MVAGTAAEPLRVAMGLQIGKEEASMSVSTTIGILSINACVSSDPWPSPPEM
jgi:hypothetical protein